MLITRSIIRRLLLREYSEYFGKEFVEFKSNFKQGENPLVIAEEMGLQKIGSGSTRVVYGLRDNPEFVLKIINTNVKMETDVEDIHGFSKHHKKLSNQWEADLRMQQLYPDVFPRSFEVADDYSWILSERVDPLKGWDDLLNRINLQGERFSPGGIGRIQFQAVIEIAIESLKHDKSFAKKLVSEALKDDDTVVMQGDKVPAFQGTPRNIQGPELFKSRVMKVLSDPHVRNIFIAMGDLDIPPREFSAKNLGISRISGKLIILDASLWKDHYRVEKVYRA